MTWTDQKIQMLKDMWGQHSASEIAEQIGGLTRNAVIGKAHRLKLSIQKSVDSSGSTTSRATGGVSGIKSSRKRVMLRPLPTVPSPVSTLPPARPLATVKDVFRSLEGIGGARSEGIAVTKAGERHCRWPVGDPRSPDFRFCGCTAHDGLPYCADHARVAYQNVSRRTRGASNNEDTAR